MDRDVELCQAQFIMNALRDGWTVKMNDKGELEFYKEKSEHMVDKGYSREFLRQYGKLAEPGAK